MQFGINKHEQILSVTLMTFMDRQHGHTTRFVSMVSVMNIRESTT